MKHFEVKAGQPVVLSLSGVGFDALRVTASGQAGANPSAPLMSQNLNATGARRVELSHEFAPGQLVPFEQLQIDPVVYGRARKAYELTVTLRNASDASATFSETVKGKLVALRRTDDKSAAGFDAPLFIVALKAQPKVSWRVDPKTGFILIETEEVVVEDVYCLLDKPLFEPIKLESFDLEDFTPIEAITFTFDTDVDAPAASSDPMAVLDGLDGLEGSDGIGGLGSSGFSTGAGSGYGTGGGGISDLGGIGTLGHGARPARKAAPKIKVLEEGKMSKADMILSAKRNTGAMKKAAPRTVSALPPTQPSDGDAKYYPVFYGTNRAPVLKAGKLIGYSPYRDTQAHYGRCIVRVPKSHKIGETGSSLAKRILTLTDDRLTLQEILEVEEKLYWTSVSQQVATAGVGKRDVVVFIHGYNVSFSEAAIRAAQLGCDLSIDGAMAFYSWPSRGTLEGYFADEATVQASATYITDFLSKIATRSKAENVHVIAHSMGNRATLEAVRDIVTAAQKRSRRLFSQFILAAPDVDAEYFKQFAAKYKQVAKRTTMYVSDRDRAVEASRFIHGSVARVGLAPPVQVVKGIDTVYAGHVDESFLGHGYVAEAWQLLNDMHQLIHLDAEPKDRSWVTKSDAGTYWELVGRV